MESLSKVVDYRLIVWSKVYEYLGKGWQPWGSPILVDSSVMQAIVKYGSASLRHIPAVSDAIPPSVGYMKEEELENATMQVEEGG